MIPVLFLCSFAYSLANRHIHYTGFIFVFQLLFNIICMVSSKTNRPEQLSSNSDMVEPRKIVDLILMLAGGLFCLISAKNQIDRGKKASENKTNEHEIIDRDFHRPQDINLKEPMNEQSGQKSFSP